MRLSRVLVAPILAFSFLVSVAETLVADVCDRDSSTVAVRAADTDSGTDGSREPDGHLVHICHCVHLHGSVPAATQRGPVGIARVIVEVGRQRAPSSIDRAPPVRPPRRSDA